jgi:alkanesulfonate monooxygenase SsuD/methylene tetrahydromethanopterin reductase-like flavin-dependent oxidoreductase (luciferase family)
MRIGLINQLNGRPNAGTPAPTWMSIHERATAAELAGFEMFVFEDALLYRDENATNGVWESVSIAAALAATTERIQLGQSVINAPYRSPAMTAKIAETLDEISGGRYVLGIGAGNTPDSDYEAFGFPIDRRYSRFAEAIQIVHALLKEGAVDFEGEFYSARQAELVLRGPRPQGPPVNIAAGGAKMLRLAVRYGDAWNWWTADETLDGARSRLQPLVQQLDAICEEEGRDPSTLERTLDLYTVIPQAFVEDARTAELSLEEFVTGTDEEIAEHILGFGDLGFVEVRCDVWPKTVAAIDAMKPIVEAVRGAEPR